MVTRQELSYAFCASKTSMIDEYTQSDSGTICNSPRLMVMVLSISTSDMVGVQRKGFTCGILYPLAIETGPLICIPNKCRIRLV